MGTKQKKPLSPSWHLSQHLTLSHQVHLCQSLLVKTTLKGSLIFTFLSFSLEFFSLFIILPFSLSSTSFTLLFLYLTQMYPSQTHHWGTEEKDQGHGLLACIALPHAQCWLWQGLPPFIYPSISIQIVHLEEEREHEQNRNPSKTLHIWLLSCTPLLEAGTDSIHHTSPGCAGTGIYH